MGVVRYRFRLAPIQLIGTPSLRFGTAPAGLPEECRLGGGTRLPNHLIRQEWSEACGKYGGLRLTSSSPGCFYHWPVGHLSGPRYSRGVCWPPLQTLPLGAHADQTYFESAGKPPLLHSSDKPDLSPNAKESYWIHLFGFSIKSIFKMQVCGFLFKVPSATAGSTQMRDPA